MTDARSLLRQQKAARRIDHPYAAYSDAGKLLCTLCHEPFKSDSQWEGHLRSTGHRTNVHALAKLPTGNGPLETETSSSHKRRHDSDDDSDEEMDDAIRKKRSKPDMNTPARLVTNGADFDKELKEQTLTPPSLTRRTSTAPSQGVEIQIPSRPATPSHRDGTSSVSTPVVPPLGPSPLIPQETSAGVSTLPPQQPNTRAGTVLTITDQVDEDEWAAFEADIAATTAPYAEDAVISAPAMTAEEHAAAAQSEEQEQERRRAATDVALADEKEEAKRALENEFEEMEELEARVRKLKEKREAIRQQGGAGADSKLANINGKENAATADDDDMDDDEEDNEEDDWVGFRYRG